MKTIGWYSRLALVILAGTLLSAESTAQEPALPTPPEPPAVADTSESASASTHIRRHRMTRDARLKAELESSLRERTRELEARIAELQAEIEALPDDTDLHLRTEREMQLKVLQKELELLESGELTGTLEDLELPEIDIPGMEGRSVIINPGGETIIRLKPPGVRPWRKKHGTKVAIFEPVYVDENDWVDGGAVSIFDHVHVAGHVNEDVVSIGGNVYVTGSVAGNVVAPFGEVYLGENAVVEGDVVSIELFDEGGVIGGRVEEVSLPRMPWAGTGIRPFFALLTTVILSIAVLAILVGLLALVAVPDNVQRVEDRLRNRPVGSFLGGLLVQVLAFPVWLLLVVTVIGIPVALLALPLVLLAAKVLGFTAISRVLGRSLLDRQHQGRPAWLLFLTGAVILHLPLLLGLAARSATPGTAAGATGLVANLIIFVGVCLLYLATTVGMGAAVFAKLGAQPRKKVVRGTVPHPASMPPPPRADRIPGPPGPATDAT